MEIEVKIRKNETTFTAVFREVDGAVNLSRPLDLPRVCARAYVSAVVRVSFRIVVGWGVLVPGHHQTGRPKWPWRGDSRWRRLSPIPTTAPNAKSRHKHRGRSPAPSGVSGYTEPCLTGFCCSQPLGNSYRQKQDTAGAPTATDLPPGAGRSSMRGCGSWKGGRHGASTAQATRALGMTGTDVTAAATREGGAAASGSPRPGGPGG